MTREEQAIKINERWMNTDTNDSLEIFAYEMGRADQKEYDNAFFNFEAAWELEKKKVREDAIDEFLELYEKFCNSDIACSREDCIGKFCPKCFRDNFMEQLKEKK